MRGRAAPLQRLGQHKAAVAVVNALAVLEREEASAADRKTATAHGLTCVLAHNRIPRDDGQRIEDGALFLPPEDARGGAEDGDRQLLPLFLRHSKRIAFLRRDS